MMSLPFQELKSVRFFFLLFIPQTAFAVGVLPEFPGPLTFGTTGSAGELLGVVPHLASICVTLDF